MSDHALDEDFAKQLTRLGIASFAQIEQAQEVQHEAVRNGKQLSLADALILTGVITEAIKANVLGQIKAQQQGGVRQLGPYKLLKKLGEGGMGAVYLAEDTMLLRKAAVKVLPKKYASDSQFLSRFRREAKAAGNLNHENIVGAYAVGEEAGVHYYAMEYCEGEPLDRIVKRMGAMPWEQALSITLQVARGLQFAHAHGFIHRDIKPANIFMTQDDVVKILDLGLSKNVEHTEADSFTTQSGMAVGTPHYISPEQAQGLKDLDGRTDIYSLGAMLYHLVTGQTPFQGSNAAQIMLKHLNEQVPNPQDLNPGLPEGVAHIVAKMMGKDPADRYADCAVLIEDLERVLRGEEPGSQMLEAAHSSVAAPAIRRSHLPRGGSERGLEPARRGTGGPRAPVAPRLGTTGPRDPVAPREPGSARSRQAQANPKGLYTGIGVGVALLFVGLLYALSGSSSAPAGGKTVPGEKESAKITSEKAAAKSLLPNTAGASKTAAPDTADGPKTSTQDPPSAPKAQTPMEQYAQAKGAEIQDLERSGKLAGADLRKRLEELASGYVTTPEGRWAAERLKSLPPAPPETVRVNPPPEPAPAPSILDPSLPDEAAWANALDLLKLVDPAKDAVAGKWVLKDGGLCSDETPWARIELPYRPPEEYDFRITFSRLTGNDGVAQLLSHSKASFLWGMGGWGNTNFGFQTVGGKRGNDNPTTVKSPRCLENGQKYVSVVQVRKNGVKALLNGQLVSSWKPEFGALALNDAWVLRDGSLLGLGSSASSMQFYKAEVLEVTGKGSLTRAAPAAQAAGPFSAKWEKLKIEGPAPERRSNITTKWTYDSKRKRCVLFGGEIQNDLWAFDLASRRWTQLEPNDPKSPENGKTRPGVAVNSALLYDPALDRYWLDFAWSYDPSAGKWSAETRIKRDEYTPFNQGRKRAAFDSARGRFFGVGETRGKTFWWFYSLDPKTAKLEKFPAPFPIRTYVDGGLAYDPKHDSFVLFGGAVHGKGSLNDTWIFRVRDNAWAPSKCPTKPQARAYHELTWSEALGAFVMVGGDSSYLKPLMDLWLYETDKDLWTEVKTDAAPPPCGLYGATTYDAAQEKIVYYDGRAGETWALELKRAGGAATVASASPPVTVPSAVPIEKPDPVPAQKAPAPPPQDDKAGWIPLFNGHDLECLSGGGNGTWKLVNGAIESVPGANDDAQSRFTVADGEVRIRFTLDANASAFFNVRQGPGGKFMARLDASDAAKLQGNEHELVFRCAGEEVTATLDGKPWQVSVDQGKRRDGRIQFNASGKLRVLALEQRP